MQARQQDELRQWEHDWRETVTSQLRDVATLARDTTLVVREMQSDVKLLMEWKADQARRQADRIEKAPETFRSTFGTYGGCLSSILYAGLSSLSLLISTAALIYTIVKK